MSTSNEPPKDPSDITHLVRQSPRLTFPYTINESWLSSRTILITGGASGFGASCVRRWAAARACVIFGDVSTHAGESLRDEVRSATGNKHVHFIHCDVSSWASQVALFKKAADLSPHGGIDSVIANAGITDPTRDFEQPRGLDEDEPPEPSLAVLDVNLKGVAFTAHLAMFWLPRNAGSKPASPEANPDETKRDRHLLLVGSIASLGPIPMQALYGTAKHGVLGLYRCLRSTSFMHGVRVSFVAPYFMDTPMVVPAARVLLAGAEIGKPEDVVEAMTRFVADVRIVGRAVCVFPRVKVKELEGGGEIIAPVEEMGDRGSGIFELNASDFEVVEAWNRRMCGMLNRAEAARGWAGWSWDMLTAVSYGAKRAWYGKAMK
jgi:NAD(P)-dependent dehydrogenase (short-subunit alcohol dehydrogenase family)